MKVRTVCGDIAPEELGFTLIHEHVIQDIMPVYRAAYDQGAVPPPEEFTDVKSDSYIDFILNELKLYKEAGGNSLCECSVYGLAGRPYEDLKKISEASGINIILGTGIFRNDLRPEEFAGKEENEIKELLDKSIDNGVEDSGVLPGFVKAAMNFLDKNGGFLQDEIDVFRACARISAERDMPMQVHLSTRPFNADQIVELVEMAKSLGADPKRINLCHTDGVILKQASLAEHIRDRDIGFSIEPHKKILDTGVNLSFDGFGNVFTNTQENSNLYLIDDYTRISALYELTKLGYENQIMLGHDFTCRLCGVANGGYGYTRVPNLVCKMLKELDLEDAAVKMIVTNPARFLAY